MNSVRSALGWRFTTGHAVWAAVLTPASVLLFGRLELRWLGIGLAVLVALAAVVTVRGRRLTGWIAALVAWRHRHRQAPPAPSEPAVGATVAPADHVSVRWHGAHLVALVELIPRPFTPTVLVNGSAFTDDVIDTGELERLLAAHCPDLEADLVSAGFRVGRSAPAGLIALYDQVVGPHPAPAHRRTWIVVRADPARTQQPAQRRACGVAGLAQYLVASATRIADQLAGGGIDARCSRSFDDFDRATEVAFERETWTTIRGRDRFTTAYHAPGGPDAWWSARADRTITWTRIRPGAAPTTTVLLTTLEAPTTPRGFSCLYGGQRAALRGISPVPDVHYELPVGSAGILVGETADRYPVFLPFDDVDVSLNLGDAQLFTQFVVRAAAAGASVTLAPQFRGFAGQVNAGVGPDAKVVWPGAGNGATTYLSPHPGLGRVTWRHGFIDTPRHRRLPIRLVNPREENRYQVALEEVR